MIYSLTLISISECLIVYVPALLAVAFITLAERKTLASMQRRLGPNATGWFGLLQAFADALKLLLKEWVGPTQANIFLFFLGPVITLVFALLGYIVIPYGPGLALGDLNLGVFYLLAVSAISTYGILLAGWSANSKYAFLGSLRSTAQLISYELVISSALFIPILLTGSLNLTLIVEAQRAVWFILPLCPIFYIFFIASVAETNRPPFDLAEAESELVSGFMTEHSAVIFVFFFLAEYASILLMCVLSSILFWGGYLPFSEDSSLQFSVLDFFGDLFAFESWFLKGERDLTLEICNNPNPFFEGVFSGVSIGLKSSIFVGAFILVRASFPRVRFDQLMSECWTIYLPLLFAFILFIPSLLFTFDLFPTNHLALMTLFFLPSSQRSRDTRQPARRWIVR